LRIEGGELMLARQKLIIVREGTEGLCSSEGTPLCRGNIAGKASGKVMVALS